MSTTDKNTSCGIRIACPDCGGALVYDIEAKAMRCLNCGNRKNVTDLPDPTRNADEMDVAEFRCASCGAELQTRENMTTARCVFCGSDVLLPARMARTKRPEWIVPFRITREQCEKRFRDHLKAEAKYAPSDLTGEDSVGNFLPVYIPYWDYDIEGESEMEFKSVSGRRDTQYYYRDTIKYRVLSKIRAGGHLYDASSAFDDETAERLAMTDSGRVPFHPGYLSSFFAEAPDVPADLLPRQNLRTKASEALEKSFSEQTGTSSSMDLLPEVTETASLGLLPVWLMASRSGSRVLYTAVDGVTGRVVCDVPPGKSKFILISAVLSVFFFLLLYFIVLPMIVWQPQLTAALCAVMAALGFCFIYPDVYETLRRRFTDTDLTRQLMSTAKGPPSAARIPAVKEKLPAFVFCLIFLSAAFLLACLYGLVFAFRRDTLSISLVIWFHIGLVAMPVYYSWANKNSIRKGLFTVCLLLILGISCFLPARSGYYNGFVNAVFNDKGALDLLLILASAAPALKFLSLFRNAGLPFIKEIFPVYLSLVLTFALFLGRLFHAPDLFFNLGSCLFLLSLCAGALILFSCQREYVTRPVPFFGKEAERK